MGSRKNGKQHKCVPWCRGAGDPDVHGYPGQIESEDNAEEIPTNPF